MDGLLLDSERPVRDCTLAAAVAVGRPIPDDLYHSLIGQPSGAVEGLLRAHFGTPERMDDFWERYRHTMDQRMAAGLPLMAGVLEILDHLDTLGLPAAVCTSTRRHRAEEHLARAGILARFRSVTGGDEVTRGKPHPEPYLKSAERLGATPAHCVVLEDSHNGIRAAHAAGMMPVMVPDLLPCTDEIRALCHRVVEDLHEARRLFG
jgi:HAD superfamily hydrolase (TIGR01509 family)